MIDLRDFLNWFSGFAENIDKTPNAKQWAKIKERVAGLQATGVAAVTPAKEASKPKPPPPKPEMKFPFIIDKDGYVRQGTTNRRVMPSEVTDMIGDLRGMDGDINTIIWADNSTGINGADLSIVAA